MNSFTTSATATGATACATPCAPVSMFLAAQSSTERPSTAERTGRRPIRRRIIDVARTIVRWRPMSAWSTPSAQAISNLSQRDRLGERN